MTETKILVLRDGCEYPTIETAVDISTGGRLVTESGLRIDPNNVLTVGDVIDGGDYTITAIGTDIIEIMNKGAVRYAISTENLEWCESCEDFHVCLDEVGDDDIDEYAFGYADAIRDCVEYLKDSGESKVRNTLKKMNTSYLSDLDTDAKIAQFVEKRFEKKPQLTLDDLKEIVGYDFDLV